MIRWTIHAENPQPRLVVQVVEALRSGAVLALPTDAAYVFAARVGDKAAAERIRRLHGVEADHQLSVLCADLSELGTFSKVSTSAFRLLKALTPGPYTFILPATREVPKRLQEPKKRSIGLRVPDHRVTLALLRELGEPLVVATARVSGQEHPMSECWDIEEVAGHSLDGVVDAGAGLLDTTTVIDLTADEPVVLRQGVGSIDGLFDFGSQEAL
ncbi:MAG: L-threonylcarbamoyladenylate synthase [Thioalkalivibrionaceae bacterium]